MAETIPSSPHIIRFGTFEVDLRAGEVRKGGVKIKLQEQPFQVLALLLERPGDVITREELKQKLWAADTFVDFEHGLNAAVKRLREALSDSADNPRFVETVPRRGYRLIAGHAAAEQRDDTADSSVVVFPFVDMSLQKDQEFFCDGMTEEIINALTKVENLRVVSRTSAFQFKNRAQDIRKIGTELNVSTVVEGSVRRANNRLRIAAQLASVADGFHIWSETYQCEMQDVFDIQDEISGAIVNALKDKLKWKLAKELGPRLVLSKPSYTKNLEAYELYLRGRYFWNKKNEEGLKKSIKCYQQAIEKDAGYALPHAGLAHSYMTLGVWEEDPAERARLYRTSQDELETYLKMVEENYEKQTAEVVARPRKK